MKTIISIDTGNPTIPESTTAIVRMVFDGTKVKRNAIVYSGTFMDQKERIIDMCYGADFIILEKIDATNKYLDRAIIKEQIELFSMLKILSMHKTIYTFEVHELVRSGRKEVITDDLMKKIELWSEGNHKTHHNDVREATRNGLYFMAKDEELNKILSTYVQHFF